MAIKSANKLGMCGSIPVLPVIPIGCQVHPTGTHYKLMGDAYVRGPLPAIVPGRVKEVKAAIMACPKEGSYSGSGTPYYQITVKPDEIACRFELWAGQVKIGYGIVDPAMEIVSTDVSLADQIDDTEDEDDND